MENTQKSNVKASKLNAFSNIINSFFGSGILGLPYGFKMAGTLTGATILIFVAVIARYCIEILLRCKNIVVEEKIENSVIKNDDIVLDTDTIGSYSEIGEYAFGYKGKIVVDIFLSVTQFGFCCVYMIFLGDNLNSINDTYTIDQYIVFVMILLMVISLIRSLKWFAPFSVIAESCTIIGLLIINAYALGIIPNEEIDDIKERDKGQSLPLFVPGTFLIFFGIATSSFEGIALVIPIQQSMKNPKEYPKILNISVILITSFFLLTGITSFYGFRETTETIITLNLPNSNFGIAIKLILCFAIFFTYPIQLYPLVQIVEEALLKKSEIQSETTIFKSSIGIKRNCVRMFIVFCTGFVAWVLPNFVEVIALTGCIGGSMLAYILPTLFYMKIFSGKLATKELILHFFILAFGIFGGIAASIDVLSNT
eukprot:TRINITY_DN355_c0_g5_i1.p1 TRINITY_DN355_c0_g5~~TRINITY_DN355_c0_g5_i1.p1  ORF type:complete len:425 (+),score=68.07 TRINITY_DN355_c0_g5_i1:384-1658(+)